MTRYQKTIRIPEQQQLVEECSALLDEFVDSVNDAVDAEISYGKLLKIGERMKSSEFPNGRMLLKRGRMFCFEAELKCTCSDAVGTRMSRDGGLCIGQI